MKNKKSLIIILLVFILVMTGSVIGYSLLSNRDSQATDPPASADDPKIPVADFTVYDIDGNEVKLSDMQGHPIVINFWVSYCFPCTSELPAFQAAYDRYKDDVVFMMIDKTDGVKETFKMATSYLEKKGYTFPVYFDTEGDAFSTMRGFGVPMTFFIDANGNQVSYISGEISSDELISRIEEII